MEAESSFGELEVSKPDELTETDPVKPHEVKMNLKTKKKQTTEIEMKLIFRLNRWGLSLLLGSLKSNRQKRINLNHMKESQSKLNLKT